MTRTQLLTTAALPALLSAPAFAQDDPYDLGVLILSAGYEAVAEDETGVAVDVITEEELEATGETRAIDFLARQPGVTLRTTGPLGTTAGVFIRGVNQNNIAVRVDGIDVSDPSGPQVAYDFGGLMTSDISRIEILRGSQSALYGSEALGGVINITTKRATRDGLSVQMAAEYGAYESLRSSVTFANKGEGHESALTLSYANSDGFSAADENDGNDEADGFNAKRLSFAGSYDLGSPDTVLHLSAFSEESTYDYDETSGGVPLDGSSDEVTEKQQDGLRIALDFVTGGFDHTVSASYFRIDRTLTGSAASFGGVSDDQFDYTGTRMEYRYQGGVDLTDTTRLVFGADHTVEEFDTSLTLDHSIFGLYTDGQSHDTSVTGLFAEVTAAPSTDWNLSAALRYDEHSEFGGFTTGRLSAVYRPTEDLIFRANAATGFRAPSGYELYDGFAGNSDLDPETSKSFDLGVEKRFGDRGYIRATAFHIEAEDIIDYSFTAGTYVQASGTSTRQGIELAGGTELWQGVRLDGSYTWTDSFADADLDSSSWSAAVPGHQAAATVTADFGSQTSLAVTGLWAGDRAEGLDPYGVLNSTLTYKVMDNAEIYLRIENVFDEEYQTAPGYGTSDRAAYFGIRASL
ncbi:TonB-dependent receptor [Phaeobacter sp. J2-8]|uniref:TonB-dependent receptor plug domain-containing protein n=1 Tax=Phaeobacter sp. J2-8 TaxID=2931394 RepID=UPI001FD32A08|nr:TonB-dependent receptor [Phaeobacter sp. J2-8]MCJ7872524.1 TonB-dependent receptor [Phaeobacter sp. J2-8]